LIRIFSIM